MIGSMWRAGLEKKNKPAGIDESLEIGGHFLQQEEEFP